MTRVMEPRVHASLRTGGWPAQSIAPVCMSGRAPIMTGQERMPGRGSRGRLEGGGHAEGDGENEADDADDDGD